jgi:hypothetical protein
MSRGDGRKDPADRLLPPHAAGMSCYSVAEEIMPGRADYLVERDGFEPEISLAVLPNSIGRSQRTPYRYLLRLEHFGHWVNPPLSRHSCLAEFPR